MLALLQDGVRSASLQVVLGNPLCQCSDDLEDLLVMVSQTCLGVGVWPAETGDIAVMVLVGRVERGRGFNVGVGHSWPGRVGRSGILFKDKSR